MWAAIMEKAWAKLKGNYLIAKEVLSKMGFTTWLVFQFLDIQLLISPLRPKLKLLMISWLRLMQLII